MPDSTQHHSKLDQALALGAQGLRVFPLIENGNTPAIKQWPERASADADTIRAMWTRPYNIGIATGDYGGRHLIALDVDVKDGKRGLESLTLLQAEQGVHLPRTREHRTRSGGRHYLFWSPVPLRNSVDRLGPGLDVRAARGYIVAPGSTIGGRGYTVETDAPIAEAPQSLIDAIGAGSGGTAERDPRVDSGETRGALDGQSSLAQAIDYLETAELAVEGAGGDATTFRVAARLLDFGLSRQMALRLLLIGWNDRCSPPWPPEDLEQKVINAARYRETAIGSASAAADFDAVSSAAPSPAASDAAAAFFTAAELDGFDIPPRRWLVPGFVPTHTVTLLYGDGGTGKSLAALQLAAACATGQTWFGQQVEAGAALLVSAEDDRDELHRRVFAVSQAIGVGLPDMRRLVLRSLVGEDALLATLDQRTGVLKPTALFAAIEERIAALLPALVVLDTLANLFPGNENDRGHVQQFVNLLKGWAWRYGCSVVMLAHPSRAGLSTGSGDSGSTGWSNAVRSRLYLERITRDGFEADADARRLTVRKSNYGRSGEVIDLRFRDGVFVLDETATPEGRSIVMAKAERVFLHILRDYAETGRTVTSNPGVAYAPSRFAEHPNAEGCTKTALKEAMESLFAAGRIVLEERGPASHRRTCIVEVSQSDRPFDC